MRETKIGDTLVYICPECNGKGFKSLYDELLGAYDDVVCWQCGGACYLDWIEYAILGGFLND